MTSWIVAAVTAVATLIAAVALRVRLRRTTHRHSDEQTTTIPDARWVLVALPLAALLVTHSLSESRHPVIGVLYAATCVPLTALTVIDIDVHRLPDRLTLPFAGASVLVTLISSAVTDDWTALGRAVAAGVLLFVVGFLILLAAPNGGLGFGDVKLVVSLGVLTGWLGWPVVLSAILIAFLTAGLWAAALLISRRAHRHTAIAFGPFLIGGTVVAMLGG